MPGSRALMEWIFTGAHEKGCVLMARLDVLVVVPEHQHIIDPMEKSTVLRKSYVPKVYGSLIVFDGRLFSMIRTESVRVAT